VSRGFVSGFSEAGRCVNMPDYTLNGELQVIVIPRYEYDIVVITRVRGEAEYEC